MALSIKVTPDPSTVAEDLRPEELYAGPLREYLYKLALVGQAEARRGAKPHGGDTGALANSIQTRIDGGTVPLWSEVYTASDYAAPANYGRGPGKMPPIDAIQAWARRHGLGDDRSTAFLIARAIGRSGTRGLHFWEDAEKEMERRMPEFVDKLSSQIGADWSNG